jgi:hypothetical protein
MPIPALNAHGLLPPGTYDCSLEEITAAFGTFGGSDRRIRLTEKLNEYVGMVREAGVGQQIYVDGSYVTNTEEPGDIDVLLILREDIDLGQELPPFQYNVRSGKFVRQRFGFDFFFGFAGDPSAERLLSLFRRVKGYPGLEKGVLRVIL